MEIIRGKNTSFMDALLLAGRTAGYDAVHIDLGTGDGRCVQSLAQTYPTCFIIGVDACRENLHRVSRTGKPNMLFVIANAERLPAALNGLAARVSVQFPWGSLLDGLLTADSGVMAGLLRITRPGAEVEVYLNADALAKAHWSLEAGTARAQQVLNTSGFGVRSTEPLTADALKRLPSTWARRLAFGRDPRATYLYGVKR